MDNALAATSKFLSLVLRHRPGAIGLSLDSHGWANVQELVHLANASGRDLTSEEVLLVVSSSGKQRFTLDASGQRIRANQGHSVGVDLQLVPLEPPAVLYHGTATRFLSSIQESGLLKGARHHVHLSLDASVARAVGSRHGHPVVLGILAEDMWCNGHQFYRSKNSVWLTDHVPTPYIRFPADVGE